MIQQGPAIDAMRHWVEATVIGLGLCPFAATAVRRGHLQFHVCDVAGRELTVDAATDSAVAVDAAVDVAVDSAWQLAAGLCAGDDRDATLVVVLPTGFDDFATFLDATALLEERLSTSGHNGILQVATFHPHYQFADAAPDDVANYTNRSPYPAWHLLQEDAVSRAVDAHPNPDGIPAANIARLRGLSGQDIRAMKTHAERRLSVERSTAHSNAISSRDSSPDSSPASSGHSSQDSSRDSSSVGSPASSAAPADPADESSLLAILQGGTAPDDLLLVYDGECPACANYVQVVRIRDTVGTLHLINAREPSPVMDEITAAGLDIDEGMVLKVGQRLFYGADAIHVLALLSSRAGLLNRLNYYLFRSRRLSRYVYPLMRSARALLLKMLGRHRVNNLGVPGRSRF